MIRIASSQERQGAEAEAGLALHDFPSGDESGLGSGNDDWTFLDGAHPPTY